MKTKLLMALTVLACTAHAQITQTVRGIVIDKISQGPLPGAVVYVMNSQPAIVSSANEKGEFYLKDVPVGKQSLNITYIGYKQVGMKDLSVNAGKRSEENTSELQSR